MPTTFGGEVTTKTMDRVVAKGIAYNRFHTTAMCSPTRAALLTGRNHHRVGNGQIAEMANDWDGYSGRIPKEQRTRCRRFATVWLCYWRLGQVAQYTRRRDYRRRAFRQLANGFGLRIFLRLPAQAKRRTTNPISCAIQRWSIPPKTPEEGYHLSEDLAEDAIRWLRNHKAFQPDKPFYMYWASGAIHGPHHIMKEWADKYKGKFDDGWDAYRERVFKRAKEKGWIPQNAQLTPRHPTMTAWDDIPENEGRSSGG